MSNTHHDLTRALYRNMTNKELNSLRDKILMDSEHAPFITAELRRRGLSTTPHPYRYNPVRKPIERRKPGPKHPAREPRPPQQDRVDPAAAVQALRQFGNRVQQSRQQAMPQQQDGPSRQPQRNQAGQQQAQRQPSPGQRPPYIKPVKGTPAQKKGCGCSTAAFIIFMYILFQILKEFF